MTKTISCEDALKELYAYLDDEVGAEKIDEVDQHFHQCSECQGRVEFEKRLKMRFSETGETPATESLKNKLKEIFEQG